MNTAFHSFGLSQSPVTVAFNQRGLFPVRIPRGIQAIINATKFTRYNFSVYDLPIFHATGVDTILEEIRLSLIEFQKVNDNLKLVILPGCICAKEELAILKFPKLSFCLAYDSKLESESSQRFKNSSLPKTFYTYRFTQETTIELVK